MKITVNFLFMCAFFAAFAANNSIEASANGFDENQFEPIDKDTYVQDWLNVTTVACKDPLYVEAVKSLKDQCPSYWCRSTKGCVPYQNPLEVATVKAYSGPVYRVQAKSPSCVSTKPALPYRKQPVRQVLPLQKPVQRRSQQDALQEIILLLPTSLIPGILAFARLACQRALGKGCF